jgi:uncharacterized protein YbjT (DUF2867 family)
MEVLKPYVLLACVAFMIGFAGYWLLGQALTVADAPPGPAYEAPVSAPAPAEDFGRGKAI